MYSFLLLQFSDQIKNWSSTHSPHLPKGLTQFHLTLIKSSAIVINMTLKLYTNPKDVNSNLFLPASDQNCL